MKKLLVFALTLVMLAGIAGIQAVAVKNLLPVTEETATPVDTAYIPGMDADNILMGAWTDVPGADLLKTVVTIDKSVKKLGSASIKIYNPKLGHSTCVIPVKTLKKNTTYTLQAWVKMDKVMSPSWGVSLGVEFYNLPSDAFEKKVNQGNYLIPNASATSDLLSGTKDWRRITLTFKTPNATFTHAVMNFQLWDAAGTVWYDGIALVEGSAAVDDSKLENPTPIPTSTPKPTTTPTPKPVEDKPSSWAQAEVTEAINAKLVPAALQSKYTSNITRSDFCDLVINMIEVKTGKKIADFVKEKTGKDLSDKPFPDTNSANVNAANKLGIVNGRTNGNFDPNGSITRQEAAKMLALAAKALGADITASASSFADAAQIASWAKEFVDYVNAIGVMKGTANNNFSPSGFYTREQSILTILRLFKALK